jgi:hypothetical protein
MLSFLFLKLVYWNQLENPSKSETNATPDFTCRSRLHRPPAQPYRPHDFIKKQKVVSFSRNVRGLALLYRVLFHHASRRRWAAASRAWWATAACHVLILRAYAILKQPQSRGISLERRAKTVSPSSGDLTIDQSSSARSAFVSTHTSSASTPQSTLTTSAPPWRTTPRWVSRPWCGPNQVPALPSRSSTIPHRPHHWWPLESIRATTAPRQVSPILGMGNQSMVAWVR